MEHNDYIPFPSRILKVIKQTDIEYTFRMEFHGKAKPGQFFEVSIPKYGEAPISVSGIGDGFVDLTIRRVGKVTNEVFDHYEGDTLLLRGPLGNGFNIADLKGKSLFIITGGTGLAPVRGVINYFKDHPDEKKNMTVLASFKKHEDIMFKDDMAAWKEQMNFQVTLTQEELEGYRSGRVSNHIARLLPAKPKDTVAVIVGPSLLMHTSAQLLISLGVPEKNIWISEERKMCCGLGKCGHCKVGKTYICLEGPVFNYFEGKKLMD